MSEQPTRLRNHTCISCGAPSFRKQGYCPACGEQHRKAHAAAYFAQRWRTSHPKPEPVPQANPDLPRIGEMLDDGERVCCHVCGRWFKSLNTHINSKHGLNGDEYKS